MSRFRASCPTASKSSGGAHLGLPPFASQSAQKESMIVSIAISYTLKKMEAMTKPEMEEMTIGQTGLFGGKRAAGGGGGAGGHG